MSDHSYKSQTGEASPSRERHQIWEWWSHEWFQMFPDGVAVSCSDELNERKFNYLTYLRDLAFGDVRGSGQP